MSNTSPETSTAPPAAEADGAYISKAAAQKILDDAGLLDITDISDRNIPKSSLPLMEQLIEVRDALFVEAHRCPPKARRKLLETVTSVTQELHEVPVETEVTWHPAENPAESEIRYESEGLKMQLSVRTLMDNLCLTWFNGGHLRSVPAADAMPEAGSIKWWHAYAVQEFHRMLGDGDALAAVTQFQRQILDAMTAVFEIIQRKVTAGEDLDWYEVPLALYLNPRIVSSYKPKNFTGTLHEIAFNVLGARRVGGWNPAIHMRVQSAYYSHEHHSIMRTVSTIAIPSGHSCRLDSWGIRIRTPELEAQMIDRGRRVADLCGKASFIQYDGNGITLPYFGPPRLTPCSGRMMVDFDAWNELEPNFAYIPEDVVSHDNEVVVEANAVDDTVCVLLPPYVPAFSFASKKWINATIDGISPIEFNDGVFGRLVYDEKIKEALITLIKHRQGVKQDVIAGKGEGFIVCMFGPPGTGKTLTAEATAEVLHQPLYMVSSGELGTDPETLDLRLAKILKTAQRWNAVLGIDECDVYLERRGPSDVERNAMVGTFLKLMEYYSGVLMLTTNRIADIDPAFFSRIGITLHYKEHDRDVRAKVIRSLLENHPGHTIDDSNIQDMASRDYNGRQFKNLLGMAAVLAKAEQRPLSYTHFQRVIDLGVTATYIENIRQGSGK